MSPQQVLESARRTGAVDVGSVHAMLSVGCDAGEFFGAKAFPCVLRTLERSLDLLELLVQSGTSDETLCSLLFRKDSRCVARSARFVLGLPSLRLDARTRRLCQRDFGVSTETLSDLSSLLRDPQTSVLPSEEAADEWTLLAVAEPPLRSVTLVETLLIAGSRLTDSRILREVATIPGDVEMVELLLCGGFDAKDAVCSSEVQIAQTKSVDGLGVFDILLSCAACIFCPVENPCRTRSFCGVVLDACLGCRSWELLQHVFSALPLDDLILVHLLSFPCGRSLDDFALSFLSDNCEDFSFTLSDEEFLFDLSICALFRSCHCLTETTIPMLRLLIQSGESTKCLVCELGRDTEESKALKRGQPQSWLGKVIRWNSQDWFPDTDTLSL